MLVGILICSGCIPKQTQYTRNDNPWVYLPGNQYIFDDGFLKVSFVAKKIQFNYAFRNLSDRDVTITASSLVLKRGNDATDYALWGEPVLNKAPFEDIVIKPGHFFRMTYPVRVRSPFYPFRPPPEPEWRLEFEATWGFEKRTYILPFPEHLRSAGAVPNPLDTAPQNEKLN
jgi:hypothetical protein